MLPEDHSEQRWTLLPLSSSTLAHIYRPQATLYMGFCCHVARKCGKQSEVIKCSWSIVLQCRLQMWQNRNYQTYRRVLESHSWEVAAKAQGVLFILGNDLRLNEPHAVFQIVPFSPEDSQKEYPRFTMLYMSRSRFGIGSYRIHLAWELLCRIDPIRNIEAVIFPTRSQDLNYGALS